MEGDDVFALAVTFYFMITSNKPFGKASKADNSYEKFFLKNKKDIFLKKYYNLTKDSRRNTVSSPEKKIENLPNELSRDIFDFFLKMFSPDPKERYTLESIKQLKWVQEPSLTLKQYEEEMKQKIKSFSETPEDTQEKSDVFIQLQFRSSQEKVVKNSGKSEIVRNIRDVINLI